MAEEPPTGSDAPAVDVHVHWFPQSALDLCRDSGGGEWFGSTLTVNDEGFPRLTTGDRTIGIGSVRHYDGLPGRLEDMTTMRVQTQLLSVLPPFFRYELDEEIAIDAAATINRELGEYIDDAPAGRFYGLSTLPMQSGTQAILEEIDRSLGDDRFVGVAIGSNVRGRHLHEKGFWDVWEKLGEHRYPVFMHPAERGPLNVPKGYFLENVLGNPTETTVALTGFVVSGVFERFPGLRIVGGHGGGYITFALGRLLHAMHVRDETGRDLEADMQSFPPGLFVDTITHSEQGLRFVLETLGGRQVLLGTDYPADMGMHDPVTFIESALAGTDHDLGAVLGGNAAALFNLPSTA